MVNKNPFVHVAVGVVLNDRREVLVALRPEDSHQGGLWEFPGGKVEDGESVEAALARELHEELAIVVQSCTRLLQISHSYSDKSVLLDVWRIERFSGTPEGREGQPIAWRPLSSLREVDFPKANERIIRALSLPERIAITPEAADFEQFRETLSVLLELKPGLIYFRQESVDEGTYLQWFAWADELCRASGIGLLFSSPKKEIVRAFPKDVRALHLTPGQLHGLGSRPLSREQLIGVSCQNSDDLAKAEAIDADFAFLSPVSPADDSAELQLASWGRFEQLVSGSNLPVFAVGQLGDRELRTSKLHGGFGIAGIPAILAT